MKQIIQSKSDKYKRNFCFVGMHKRCVDPNGDPNNKLRDVK